MNLLATGRFYVVLCEYAGFLWGEDVGPTIGFGKCLHASDKYNADVRLFLETGETHMQLIKA